MDSGWHMVHDVIRYRWALVLKVIDFDNHILAIITRCFDNIPLTVSPQDSD